MSFENTSAKSVLSIRTTSQFSPTPSRNTNGMSTSSCKHFETLESLPPSTSQYFSLTASNFWVTSSLQRALKRILLNSTRSLSGLLQPRQLRSWSSMASLTTSQCLTSFQDSLIPQLSLLTSQGKGSHFVGR